MKMILDLERLVLFRKPICIYDAVDLSHLSYRTRLRIVHHLRDLGLVELHHEETSSKGGKDKKFWYITKKGRQILHFFSSL